MQGGGAELFLEEAGPGPPAAADLQDPGLGRNPGDALDPLDDAALDHDPDRIVDHQPFGPVKLHGFTPRWITAMPLVRRRYLTRVKPISVSTADNSSGWENIRMDSGR